MSFVQNIEEAIEELSDWTVETINEILAQLMPDGRPFFQEPKTKLEELEEYAKYRGNSEAWVKFMAEQVGVIIMELQDSAVPPDLIISTHPVNIVEKTTLAWSAEMEEEMKKEEYHGLFS